MEEGDVCAIAYVPTALFWSPAGRGGIGWHFCVSVTETQFTLRVWSSALRTRQGFCVYQWVRLALRPSEHLLQAGLACEDACLPQAPSGSRLRFLTLHVVLRDQISRIPRVKLSWGHGCRDDEGSSFPSRSFPDEGSFLAILGKKGKRDLG